MRARSGCCPTHFLRTRTPCAPSRKLYLGEVEMHYHQCALRAFGCDALATGKPWCAETCSHPTLTLDELPAFKVYLWGCDDALFSREVRYMLFMSRVELARALDISYVKLSNVEFGRSRLRGELRAQIWALVEDAMRAPSPEIKALPGVCPACDGMGVTHHPDFVTRPCHVCAE
jgi:hypothetical protein